MSGPPPPQFQSNYPRGQQTAFGYLRPPGVYFDSLQSAFDMLKADWGVYVVGSLICVGAIMVVYLGLFGSLLGFGSTTFLQPRSGANAGAMFVIQMVIGFVSNLGYLCLISIGVGHLERGSPALADMFMPFRRFGRSLIGVFVLLVPTLVTSLASLVMNLATDPRQISTAFMGFAIILAISTLCWLLLYGPLLLGATAALFSDLDPIQAFGEVFRRLGWSSLLLSLLVFVASLVAGLGACACGVGVLFTMPVLTNVVALHYAYIFPRASVEPVAANPYFPPR